MQNPFLTDRGKYLKLADQGATAYRTASPFPHGVYDNFMPVECGELMISQYPSPTDPNWRTFNDPTGLKLASSSADQLGAVARDILHHFSSAPFLEFLERLTGIEGLIPDPWFEGGGLHQIPRGGFLKIHADFNFHTKLKLHRRINVLWYLNEDWKEEYGGNLELWDREMKGCVQRILPNFNRCVIFNTTDLAYHGHPEPLTCPEGRSRKSVALYYYTQVRPEEELVEAHSTLYQMRPDEIARTQTLSYRAQMGLSKVLEMAASIAHKPSGLLRRLSEKIRPRH